MKNHEPVDHVMTGQPLGPLEKTVSHRHRLLHLKYNLKLEDRGGFKRNVFDKDKRKFSSCTNDTKDSFQTTFGSARFNKVRWCYNSVKRLMLVVLLVIVSEARICAARNFAGEFTFLLVCKFISALRIGTALYSTLTSKS